MPYAKPYDRDVALDAAQSLFWEKGYHATSIKDLTRALDMKPGSIYAAFSSKENLYLLAIERYYQENIADLLGAVDGAESPLAVLANYLRNLAGGTANDPCRQSCMLVKTVLDTTDADGDIPDRARAHLDAVRDAFVGVFELSKAKGEIPTDADAAYLAMRFQSDVTAVKIEAHRGTKQSALATLAEDFARGIEQLRIN